MCSILVSIGFSNAIFNRQLSWCMGYIADNSRKFFHPAAINEMLSTFLPQLDGTKLDVRLSILEMRHFTDILSGHLVIPLLSNDIPPVKPPTTLPPHVVPRVGVAQLLQV